MNTEKIMVLCVDYEQRFNFKMTNLLYTYAFSNHAVMKLVEV